MDLRIKRFEEIDLNDSFFDSLKNDYTEFEEWFLKKAKENAYVFYGENESIEGFLYLKHENDAVLDVEPILSKKSRIKIGTFKINAHGTRVGERYVKKVFDHAVTAGADEIYVTVFEKHHALIDLFSRYGFKHKAFKNTANGKELVLLKKMKIISEDVTHNYPIVQLTGKKTYLLSLYPKWHTRLLPDSILMTEVSDIIKDVSHSNSIHKVYLASMDGMELLKRGDVIIIYRTSDVDGMAYYRSVATSICVIEEYRNLNTFCNKEEFSNYCRPYSVFTEPELETLWRTKKYKHVIRFMYNLN